MLSEVIMVFEFDNTSIFTQVSLWSERSPHAMEQLSWCAHLLSLCFGAQELELLRQDEA